MENLEDNVLQKRQKKFRSVKRYKRRFVINQYKKSDASTPTSRREKPKTKSQNVEVVRPVIDDASQQSTSAPPSISASARKLSDTPNMLPEEPSKIEGYRFMDMAVLSTLLKLLICPKCKQGHISVEEEKDGKMGLASNLKISCTRYRCDFSESFYTSSRIDGSQAFDVNTRVVLAERNIGVGYQGLVKFTIAMNMPMPISGVDKDDNW